MSKLLEEKKKTLAYVSAIRTALDNYPKLNSVNSVLNLVDTNTPISLILGLLHVCGVDEIKLLGWLSKMLCGQDVIAANNKKRETNRKKTASNYNSGEARGALDIIEEGIKALLLLNVKNMFTCSLNPIIPENVLTGSQGIEIPLQTIDIFSVLRHAPNSNRGKTMYFDNEYSPNEMWKSRDFNCFLWYVVNKSTNIESEKYKCVWDNRVRNKVRKKCINDSSFKNNFFSSTSINNQYISSNDTINKGTYKGKSKTDRSKYLQKNQYITVEYNEVSDTSSIPDSIKLYLNRDRYTYDIIKGGNNINYYKTVFEFNYDYIYSLKLFDSKTIVGLIVNSLLGSLNSAGSALMTTKYSFEQSVIAGKISEIIKSLANKPDTVIDDSYFSFSNDEFNELLNEAELKHSNSYRFGEIQGSLSEEDTNKLIESINNIGEGSNLETVQTNITNVFTQVLSATSASQDEIGVKDKLGFENHIIFKLLQLSITEIVLQVLSPKVMLLYALNAYFMGDITDNDFKSLNIKNLLKGLTNLISQIVKQIFEYFIKELLAFLIQEIQPLIMAIIILLAREKINFIIRLLQQLLSLGRSFHHGSNNGKMFIDKVNYADIVPEANPNNV